MNRFYYIVLLLLISVSGFSQEEVVHSVYFEFDKYNLTEKQAIDAVAFINGIDTTRVESIQIYGLLNLADNRQCQGEQEHHNSGG